MAEDIKTAIAKFEEKLTATLLRAIQLEMSYDVEVAHQPENHATYDYLLQVEVSDLLWRRDELLSVSFWVIMTDTKDNSEVYRAFFEETPDEPENLMMKIVRHLPNYPLLKPRELLIKPIEWLNPSQTTPGPEDYPEANAIYLVDEMDIHIHIWKGGLWTPLMNADNFYTKTTHHVAIKILNKRGYEHAEILIPFDDRDNIEMLKARTITPDGRIIEVSANQIFEINLFPDYCSVN